MRSNEGILFVPLSLQGWRVFSVASDEENFETRVEAPGKR